MNRKLVVAVVIITSAGVASAWIAQKPITPVIIGAYIFMFVLSILDLYGGPMSNLAGAIAMLAATFVILTEVPWSTILQFVRGGSISLKNTVPGATSESTVKCTALDSNGTEQNGMVGICLPGFCFIQGVGCLKATSINGKAV